MSETVLKQAATLIPVRDGENGLEVLLVKRQRKASFLPNVWVFPGGVLEQQDQQGDAWQSATQAAIRETQEETGFEFTEQCLVPFSRWLAPKEAEKRFDTFFFLAKTDESTPVLQLEEVVDSQWICPKQAVAQHHNNELSIIPPTVVSLKWLSCFNHAKEAIDFFKQQQPFIFEPKVCFQDTTTIMVYDGDVAYENQDLALQGPQHRCLLESMETGWHYLWDESYLP